MPELSEELRLLGGQLGTPAPDLADRVLTRLSHQTSRPSGWLRAAAVLVGLLVAVGLAAAVSPQVRAAIRTVFGVAGVDVLPGAGPTPAPTPVLPADHATDLAGAAREAGFAVRVPSGLGDPAQVRVADGRVVTLLYPGGVRIEEFAGTLAIDYQKYIAGGVALPVSVGGDPGLWFEQPITLVYIDRDGIPHPESARQTAGHTLTWTAGALTLRIEGVPTRAGALALATTIR
jgi:hypothetical protein